MNSSCGIASQYRRGRTQYLPEVTKEVIKWGCNLAILLHFMEGVEHVVRTTCRTPHRLTENVNKLMFSHDLIMVNFNLTFVFNKF